MKWTVEHDMVVRREGEGPRLVWIHGLGESSVSFEPLLATLPGFTHVLVDLPGYGRSAWPEHAMGLSALADHLSRWLDEEPPAVVIGHSMGGVLSTLVAERTTVRGVVNIEGNLSAGDCTFSALAFAYTLDDFCARGFAEMRAKVYADGASKPELRGYHAAMCFASPAMFHRNAWDLVDLSNGGTLAPRLADLKVPKLYVAGVPDGICVESRALLDHHAIHWLGIEPAGHWVYLDQLARFTDELGRFLSQH